MERWNGKVVLVTGASEGIGAKIATLLVSYGMKVVGCSRHIEKIQILGEELKNEKGSLTAIRCDLRKEEDILNMFKSIKDDGNLGGVDVCINNAGIGHNAPLLSGLTEEWKDMLEVNVIAPAICSREAYKSMKERGVDDGHIIYINSMSGHRIGSKAFSHFICATKFGLTAMVEATRRELRELKSHIRVTAISPGNVVTPFASKLFKDKSKGEALYSQNRCMDAKDIADTVVFALQVPQHVEINDVLMRPTEGVH